MYETSPLKLSRIWQAVLIVGGALIAVSAFIFIGAVAGAMMGVGEDTIGVFSAVSIFAMYTLVAGVIIIIRREKLKEVFSFYGWNGGVLVPVLLLIIGFNIIGSEIDNFTREYFPVPDYLIKAFEEMCSGSFKAFCVAVIAAPLIEEFLFRGVLLKGFLSRYTLKTSVVFSAILFALVHMNIYQAPVAIFLSIVTGIIFYKTQSLWLCIATHAINNCFVVVAFPLLLKSGIEIKGYTGYDLKIVEHQPIWLTAIGTVILLAGSFLLKSKLSQQDDEESNCDESDEPINYEDFAVE